MTPTDVGPRTQILALTLSRQELQPQGHLPNLLLFYFIGIELCAQDFGLHPWL